MSLEIESIPRRGLLRRAWMPVRWTSRPTSALRKERSVPCSALRYLTALSFELPV